MVVTVKTSVKRISVALVGALLTLSAVPASAAPVSYEGVLAGAGSVSGTIAARGWADNNAAGVDFWSFHGTAGQVVNLTVARTDSRLDPVMDLYRGVTSADESEFVGGASFGGLSWLASGDDELPSATGSGPYGDPQIANQTLLEDGLYTIIIGGYESRGRRDLGYILDFDGLDTAPAVSAVPLPGAAVLLLSGMVVLGVRRAPKRS